LKGIETQVAHVEQGFPSFSHQPDLKGIETIRSPHRRMLLRFLFSHQPDLKGIETLFMVFICVLLLCVPPSARFEGH
jgi:hypothetical protein